MAELHALPKPSKLADDTANVLRELAHQIDRGEVNAVVLGAEIGGEYQLFNFSSVIDTLVLTSLLHRRALNAF